MLNAFSKGYPIYEWIVLLTYIIIAFVSVLVNGFILITVVTRRLTTTTYLLIANQATSDLLCGCIYLGLWYVCSTWFIQRHGDFLCKMTLIVKLGTFFVSAFTLMTIAIDRYSCICRPLQASIKATPAIVVIWIGGLTLSTYQLIYYEASEFFTENRLIGCHKYMLLGSDFILFGKFNMIGSLVFALVLPTLVTVVLYYKVLMTIRQIRIAGRENQEERRNRKMTKMLTLIVLWYDAFCAPIFLLFFFDLFFHLMPPKCDSYSSQSVTYVIFYCMAVASTAVNPIVCCVYNQEFKKQLYILIGRRKQSMIVESTSGSAASQRSRESNV